MTEGKAMKIAEVSTHDFLYCWATLKILEPFAFNLLKYSYGFTVSQIFCYVQFDVFPTDMLSFKIQL